ncbi:hypothetical protein BGZ76_001780 [Entomortierella beljakovae]|nr:hypothetical protein BGZ76_001780 [Entomortierella beljakovae]
MTPLRQSTILVLVSLLLTSWLIMVQAAIQCKSPQTGTFNAGDTLTLDWASDGKSPTVADINSMSATLNCDNGKEIANMTITSWTAANNWVIPSVGNATTAGGTAGVCPSNSFHVEYSGVATDRVLLIPIQKSFKVSCNSITIMPAPNNTVIPTTAPATTTSTTTTTKSTTTTSGKPSPTNSDNSDSDSKPKTFVIVIVAIVAALIVFLLAFCTWWYLRKQKLQRMQNAIMPWSTQSNNQFSKVPSMDGGHRSGSINGASASGYGVNKPQPGLPQPQKSYYPEEDYNYNQHGAGGGYGGYSNGQDYNNGQDDYYNPNYAANMHNYAASPPSSNGTFYNGKASYVDPRDPYQQGGSGGFYPPPPPTIGSSPQFSTSQLNELPEPTAVSLSSGSLRSPQVIIPEKDGDGSGQTIPMNDLSKSS